MAWLAKLDARMSRYPVLVVVLYTAVKAFLIVTGAIALGRVFLDKIGLWRF